MLRKRLMIADDYEPFADLCREILEVDFEVVGVASDGLELLTQALVLRPDVVVLDINMPEMNGIEAGKRLRELLPLTKLIFVTATGSPEDADLAVAGGASAFLLKCDCLRLPGLVWTALADSENAA
jgi:CheY-like chemotaxis protein